MQSWNSSHGSRCSLDQLKSSGGAGLIYCFATDDTAVFGGRACQPLDHLQGLRER